MAEDNHVFEEEILKEGADVHERLGFLSLKGQDEVLRSQLVGL